MDALAEIRASVTEQAVTCDVYRDTDDGPYDNDMSTQGTVDVAIADASGQSTVAIEGVVEDTSLVGHIVPTYSNGSLVETVHVNDELRPQATSTRYDVHAKVGVPNELAPDLWELALQRANATP